MTTFIEQLKQIEQIKNYSEKKQNLLDDMASAFISDNKGNLDESIKAIKTMRKALKMQGYKLSEINEYILQYSYLSKTQISKMFSESIYNEDTSIKNNVACIPHFFTDMNYTDMIINELKTRPALVQALKKNTSIQNLNTNYGIKNPTLLKEFYHKYENFIIE